MGNLFCCVQVDQSTVAIKGNFGKFDDVLGPGCHCVPWFIGDQIAGKLSLRVQQLDVRCETKTKDNVFVNVIASIQYRVLAEKANDAFYKLTDSRSQIQAYVFDVIRASVPRLNLDDVFDQKNEIAKAVADELEKAMSHYGFEIVQTLIIDIEPDEGVKRAMNEINAATRLRVAANDKAEAEKILQIKKAEGEAESTYLSGLGIARQRQAIVDGLRDSVLGFSDNVPGTSAKDVIDMILVTQYFDTMKDIGAASKTSAIQPCLYHMGLVLCVTLPRRLEMDYFKHHHLNLNVKPLPHCKINTLSTGNLNAFISPVIQCSLCGKDVITFHLCIILSLVYVCRVD